MSKITDLHGLLQKQRTTRGRFSLENTFGAAIQRDKDSCRDLPAISKHDWTILQPAAQICFAIRTPFIAFDFFIYLGQPLSKIFFSFEIIMIHRGKSVPHLIPSDIGEYLPRYMLGYEMARFQIDSMQNLMCVVKFH